MYPIPIKAEFSKVLCIGPLCRNYTRALTFQSFLKAETQGDTDRTIAAWLKRRQKRSGNALLYFLYFLYFLDGTAQSLRG
jgi:hypothetical protein